ncbi:unnamed protein product [Clonostachys rosea]|uniref:Uncharacterized protein n=1 Tax=Bionectria ochroleuca TaxID=29856 RepID=A0ABY6TZF2_BIOOC|nr:unnamed protein product [Clonostachys rosea]
MAGPIEYAPLKPVRDPVKLWGRSGFRKFRVSTVSDLQWTASELLGNRGIQIIDLKAVTFLLEESRWKLWPPHGESLAARLDESNWRLFVGQAPICVMLYHISRRVPPIAKDLGSQDMSSHSTDGLVALLGQPLVPKILCVIVVNLEGAVVDVSCRSGAQKETVVVYHCIPKVKMAKHGHNLSLAVLHYTPSQDNDLDRQGTSTPQVSIM